VAQPSKEEWEARLRATLGELLLLQIPGCSGFGFGFGFHFISKILFHISFYSISFHSSILYFILFHFVPFPLIRCHTGPFYVMVASKTMQAIHIVVFVRASIARLLSNVIRPQNYNRFPLINLS
jgi:hypothetical protein